MCTDRNITPSMPLRAEIIRNSIAIYQCAAAAAERCFTFRHDAVDARANDVLAIHDLSPLTNWRKARHLKYAMILAISVKASFLQCIE